jgi:ribosomal protein S18 acetylase RimI-like enzyme
MDMNLNIRDARVDELDDVARLLRDAFTQYQKAIPCVAWKEYLRDIMDVRSRFSTSELIVAERDGRLAGSVTLYPAGSTDSSWPEGWAGVRLLGVHPDFRGQGIGRALMEECLRRCRKAATRTIGLHTTGMMAVAQEMYERMGFIRVPEFDVKPRPDIVVMAYKLQL